METKRNRPTLSKKSWKGNSVDDSGTEKYPYQTEDISRLNHIPEFYIPDVLQYMFSSNLWVANNLRPYKTLLIRYIKILLIYE